MVGNCNKFYFVNANEGCQQIASANGITLAQFQAWNPDAGTGCSGLWANAYACVGIIGFTPTVTPTATSTKSSNGISTPTPDQPGMVDNCNKFYMVNDGEGCSDIAAKNGITLAQFLTWNPQAGSTCTGLWSKTYACVGIIGFTPTITTTPTSTKSSNGISTPTPTQPGMVDNCNKFYMVNDGEGCADIASKNGISLSQFLTWNPQAGSTCTGLWSKTYACVGVIGVTPTITSTRTTTTKSNGVTTPTPTQSGMVGNCKTFYFVQSTDTCDSIAKKYGITTANFISWNPAVKPDCTGMWAQTYACVALI
jgi:LysM repeat protein